MASYSWAMWLIKPAPAALPGWCELNGSQVSSEPSQIQTSEVGSCGRNRSPLLDQPGVCIRSYAHRPGTPVKQAIHFSLVGLSCRASCNISLNYFNLVPAEYGKAKINGTTQDILSLNAHKPNLACLKHKTWRVPYFTPPTPRYPDVWTFAYAKQD